MTAIIAQQRGYSVFSLAFLAFDIHQNWLLNFFSFFYTSFFLVSRVYDFVVLYAIYVQIFGHKRIVPVG